MVYNMYFSGTIFLEVTKKIEYSKVDNKDIQSWIDRKKRVSI